MIAGLSSSLPDALTSGLQHQGVPHGIAHQVGTLPPVSSLFAAVLGVNPLQHLLAPSRVLSTLPAAAQQPITGREFFPDLISGPFRQGLVVVFAMAAALAALAAVASLLRGGGPVPVRAAAPSPLPTAQGHRATPPAKEDHDDADHHGRGACGNPRSPTVDPVDETVQRAPGAAACFLPRLHGKRGRWRRREVPFH